MNRNGIHRLQAGFSLIEVLVATAVFSLGLGGLALMMQTSVHGTLEARNQTMATQQAAALAELILLNPSSLGHYINPPADIGGYCMGAEGCSAADWAGGNLIRWQEELEQSLAGATGSVCHDASPDDGNTTHPSCDGSGDVVVKVFWVDPHHLGDADGGVRRAVSAVSN